MDAIASESTSTILLCMIPCPSGILRSSSTSLELSLKSHLLDCVDRSVTVRAPDGRLLYANAAAVSALGTAPSEEQMQIPGPEGMRSSSSSSSSVSSDRWQPQVPPVFEGEFLQRQEQGEPLQVRVLIERADAERDRYLASLVASKSQSGMLLLDPAGRIEWANESFLASMLRGRALAEVRGAEAAPLLTSDPRLRARIAEALAARPAARFELPMPVPPPSRELLATPGAAAGRANSDRDTPPFRHLILMPILPAADAPPAHWIVKLYDVTEVRRLSAEQLANKLRVEFFNTVSHELRTPLNSIIGLSSMLLQSEKAVDPAELRRCLSIILCCGEILHILLNNLIDLRKLASGKFEVLGAMPLDPSAALRRAADACGPIAAEKSLRLSVDIAPGVPRFLTADAHCLHQILVNLLSNAVKFSPPGGEINLALRLESGPEQAPQQQQPQPQPQQPPPQPPAEPQPPPPGERVVFEVADHGIGISPERLQQLFGPSTVNPAFPSGAPLSAAAGLSEFGGAGIGLLVSRRLAELMGGVLTAQSDLGRGSRFLFSLPLSLPSAEQLSFLPSAPEEPLPGILEPVLRILVVEDNLLNQKVLLRILEKMGFTADVVNDGRQCLEKLTLADYDLVLMDIAMPVMNGLEASRYIMEHWSDARRPMIVAVTANSMANADEYRAAGMDRAIFKPITMAKIADVLRDAIRKARQRSPLRRFSV